MNIAADCEINDDVFGDGLVRPEGAVRPQSLGPSQGELMEAARSWDEDDPDYVPDAPPQWARVVDIGS